MEHRSQWTHRTSAGNAGALGDARALPGGQAATIVDLALWSLSLGLAFVAQRTLLPGRNIESGLALYALAVLLLLGGEWRTRALSAVQAGRSAGVDEFAPAARPGRLRALAGGVTVASGALVLVNGVYSLAATGSSSLALPLWLAALALIAFGVAMLGGAARKAPLPGRRRLEPLVVATIVVVAFALRFLDLAAIPRDVHGDEAAVGIAARGILTGDVKNIFSLGWASLPQLSFAASALTLWLFGNDLFGLRLASAIQGALSVGLLYGVAKHLFSTRVAVVAAIILAVSQMAVHYGRIGNNYVQALFVSLLLFYFLLCGLSTRRPVYFLLAGYAVGLSASVYLAARLTPVLAVLYCTHLALSEPGFLRRHWRGFLVLALGAALFLAPQALNYVRDPLSAFDRTSGVFVLRPDNLRHEFGALGVQTIPEVLWVQFVKSVGAFNYFGETSMQYGQRAPLLDFWSGALSVLGLALAMARARRPAYLLVVSWFWLTLLLGSVLTVDAMFSPHIVAALGTLAILPALALDAGWQIVGAVFDKWGKRVAVTLVAAFSLLIAGANYIDYFQTHTNTMEPESFFTVLSRYAEQVNDRYRLYLLADRDTSLRYDTARFLVPRIDGVDVRDSNLPMPLDRVPSNKGVVFIVRWPTDARLAAIKAAYPRGQLAVHNSNDGFAQFTSYRVERVELLAAAPDAFVDSAPIPALGIDQLRRE